MAEATNKRGFFQLEPGQKYDESRSEALLALFRYSILMFSAPLLVYFGSQHVLQEYFEVESPWNNLGPAIIAIFSVNIIIILYVMRAFRESRKEDNSKKDS